MNEGTYLYLVRTAEGIFVLDKAPGGIKIDSSGRNWIVDGNAPQIHPVGNCNGEYLYSSDYKGVIGVYDRLRYSDMVALVRQANAHQKEILIHKVRFKIKENFGEDAIIAEASLLSSDRRRQEKLTPRQQDALTALNALQGQI